tara:strand:+ start:86 stop:775 length:690 start_codon:yes stop_codon:yes gene_type:complete
MKVNYHLSRVSSNRKTGPIPVSSTSRNSCPGSCPFNNSNEGGCYGENYHLKRHWDLVDKGERGTDFEQFLREVRALPRGQLWRHNQVGDLPGESNRINAAQLRSLAKANKGRKGFTFTHKPPTPTNLSAIREANAYGFTINLSANSISHAEELEKHGLPLVTVLPADAPTFQRLASGTPVLSCPATRKDSITCANCGICQLKDRNFIVGFPAHGKSWKRADRVARNTTK